MKNYIFTSESVTEGHPDKICDQIADRIVDAALSQDPYSNMAVECTIKDDFVLIYGEANTKASLDYEKLPWKRFVESDIRKIIKFISLSTNSRQRFTMRLTVMKSVPEIKESCLDMLATRAANICRCLFIMRIS